MKQQIIERFPGISCAWADTSGKTASEYHGLADKESQTFVNQNTIFPACSVSKFITAICLMKLHEQGAIDIDDPVNHYLHQWKLRTMGKNESNASIRSILCHTAGIVDGDDAFYGLRRNDPEISLIDILEGKTSYNNRPARAEKPEGTAFEYSDAGYCVLQLMLQELMRKAFEDIAREVVFTPLCLDNSFFASRKNIVRFENRMATGYDEEGLPIPGKFPSVPDLAASGMWSTPKELLKLAKEIIMALHCESSFLQEKTAQEMTRPVDRFPWTGLGLFLKGKDTLISQGWGENGQCMVKMNIRTKKAAVVMTNRNPGVDQTESGIELLADRKLSEKE